MKTIYEDPEEVRRLVEQGYEFMDNSTLLKQQWVLVSTTPRAYQKPAYIGIDEFGQPR